jgi:hypothetical protein
MIDFGEIDFWTVHGWGFILAMCFFPRLTLIFGTVHGGLLWWLGLIFVPRLQVAIIATLRYGETNPMLVALTWLWALSGESGEKKTVRRATRKRPPEVTVHN